MVLQPSGGRCALIGRCCVQVKEEGRAQEVLDLAQYERSEELRKAKSRSKKNHSRFTVLRRHQQVSLTGPDKNQDWTYWTRLDQTRSSPIESGRSEVI